jgi:hypothetical protein
MRGLAITVAALSMLAAGAVAAQADANQGGPIKKGNQCWHASPMSGGINANGFGFWEACPATASTPVATPRAARKKSSR